MSIYKSNENEKLINTHVIFWDREEGLSVGMQICCYTDNVRFATKEEKAKLFDAIKDNGYKWDTNTKTLGKLVKPKFKVDDKIKLKGVDEIGYVTQVTDCYFTIKCKNNTHCWAIEKQDEWELVPEKFDITTLVPFESRVLVRHNIDNKWCGSFFSHIDDGFHSNCYKYVTVAGKSYPMCIPYEGNEHLLGATNDCIEYYKTW